MAAACEPSDVAVIGMSCRFPGSPDLRSYWDNLVAGRECITFFPSADQRAPGPGAPPARSAVSAAGILEQIENFDAEFFGIRAHEAELMDPQHRLMLECAWHALEDAGYDPHSYAGYIGVYAGACLNSYMLDRMAHCPGLLQIGNDFDMLTGSDRDYLTTRLSYKLNLRGPSINIQTACSTSLVAVHAGCEGLLAGECDIALAGGVTVRVPHEATGPHVESGIFSADGRCRPFDIAASGTVVGNGVGMVVLKRCDDARRDGDHIYAVIKGSAVNNDGNRKVGFTAPSVAGQRDVIAQALAVAGFDSSTVTYVEAHGTGTVLGDPIEFAALKEVFGAHMPRRASCGIGSVKSNIGHLDTAAGVAGFIKTVLALYHQSLPATLHFHAANPKLGIEGSPFYVVAAHQKWPSTESPRRAGVSSFGIGGTNAHVVLQEEPVDVGSETGRAWHVLPLSARTEAVLLEYRGRLAQHLEAVGEAERTPSLADVAYTLQIGRHEMTHRAVVLAQTLGQAVALLRAPEVGRSWSGRVDREPVTVAMLFGNPVDVLDQARGLAIGYEGFRRGLKLCLPTSNGEPAAIDDCRGYLGHFAITYAAGELLRSLGVEASATAGHGLGLCAAAVFSGALQLHDVLALMRSLDENALYDSQNGNKSSANFPACDIKRIATKLAAAPWREPVVRMLLSAGRDLDLTRCADVGFWERELSLPARGLAETLSDAGHLIVGFGPGPDGAGAAHIDVLAAAGAFEAALGQLWIRGLPLAWRSCVERERRRRVALPGYPFQRRRYWLDAPTVTRMTTSPTPAASDDIARMFYVPSWRRAACPIANGTHPSRWLLLGGVPEWSDEVGASLQSAGHSVVRVDIGERFEERSDGSIVMPPADASAYRTLLAALDASGRLPERIVHLRTLRDDRGRGDFADRLERLLQLGTFDLSALYQALGSKRLASKMAVVVVTSGLENVAGDDDFDPANAPLLGLCPSLRIEYPAIRLSCIDVGRPPSSQPSRARLARRLMVEAMADSAEPLIAYRGDARWLRAYDSLPCGLTQIAPPVLHDRGVYLIVGGLGAIGLTIAEYLARAVCARLILVARSPFPPRSQWDDCLDDDCAAPDVADKIRTIRKLEELGGEVLICQADVCDGAAMARVVEAATQAFGPVAGVVHAAGVSGSALIQDHSPDAMRRTLAPKVQGAAVLAQLFENRQLDFLVFFSSTLGYLGGMGQADYAAASAFLDMYAEWHRLNCATRTTSIAWTSWRDVGMAAPVVQQHVIDCSNDWRVAEHRLGGRGVLPGTAYIELIVQTFRRRVNRQPMEIRDVMLLRPWFAPESGRGEVETRLLRQVGDRFTVEIVDRATGMRHATAMLSSLSVEEPQRVEVSDILARCPNQIPIGSPETGATAVERQLWLGERWHCLQRVQSGKDEAVACLELDAKFAGDVESHPLHPALVDVATSCVLHRFDDGPYVPFSCRRIRFYRSLPRQMIAHLKWQPGTSVSDRPVSVDVSICDLAGTRLVELEGYAFVRAGSRSLTAAPSAPENPVERLQAESRGISAKQAIEAFVRILANDPPPRVIVSRDPIAEPGHDNDDRDAAAKEIRNEPATSFHARPALSTELVMATGRVERQIVEAWQKLLGIAPIGIHDNFMELGGDSIVALQIIARCDAVGIHLTPVQFFDHPTVAELARLAEQRDDSVATTTAAPGDATGEADKFPLAKLRPGDLEKLYAEFGSSE